MENTQQVSDCNVAGKGVEPGQRTRFRAQATYIIEVPRTKNFHFFVCPRSSRNSDLYSWSSLSSPIAAPSAGICPLSHLPPIQATSDFQTLWQRFRFQASISTVFAPFTTPLVKLSVPWVLGFLFQHEQHFKKNKNLHGNQRSLA